MKTRTIITSILGILALIAIGAAVLISQRLSTQQPVAPTAPQSQPKAASCSLDFTVPTAGVEVCKVIKANGSYLTTWSALLPSTFSIDIYKSGGSGTTTGDKIQTVSFALSDTPSTDIGDGIMAVCKDVSGAVGEASVIYKEETIGGDYASAWSTPLYNDGYQTPITTGYAFNANGSSDGIITLGDTKRRLILFNEYTTPGYGVCENKIAYKDTSGNSAGKYDFSDTLRYASGDSISPGTTVVYRLMGKKLSANAVNDVVWTDTLDSSLTYVDGSSCITYDASTRKITCNSGKVAKDASYDIAFRAKASSSLANGYDIYNTATVTTTSSYVQTCSTYLNVEVAATATPTPTPTPSPSPTVTPTPSPTPIPLCGSTCSTNADCPSTMVCNGGVCRNPSCSSNTNCICATSTPAPTTEVTAAPTALPVSGTVGQTFTVMGVAIGVIIIGILGFLAI